MAATRKEDADHESGGDHHVEFLFASQVVGSVLSPSNAQQQQQQTRSRRTR